VTTHINPY